MKQLTTTMLFIVLLFSSSCFTQADVVDDTIFPLRDTFHTVDPISHQTLALKMNEVIIVDVRSEYEFSVLHINNAINVPITNLGFIPALQDIRANDDRDIIFYCNGITCTKSYIACIKAKEAGINNVYTFDLGVLNWAKLYPKKSAFFNQSPLEVSQLIPPEKFRQHLLLPKDFIKKITPQSLVIDIREPFQRNQLILTNISTLVPVNQFHNAMGAIKKKNTHYLYVTPWVNKYDGYSIF